MENAGRAKRLTPQEQELAAIRNGLSGLRKWPRAEHQLHEMPRQERREYERGRKRPGGHCAKAPRHQYELDTGRYRERSVSSRGVDPSKQSLGHSHLAIDRDHLPLVTLLERDQL